MESFEELAETYKPMINKIMSSLHIYKNQEEYFQLGLIGLWEASKHFNEEKGSFLNYAYTHIKGRFLSEMTNQNKREERFYFPTDLFWDTVISLEQEREISHSDIAYLCKVLSEPERKWLQYTCIDCLKTKEIAEKEKVSISLVKKWRKNVREKIRKQLVTTT
ncbi:sigma-70 family RNA polymerase sigma factor [Bacillus sp. DNRA2]|uniref:sigma-70 family RNA polymerase sigma factor n=1 Tax=Bacillus sp. DNRA2 TaxID=2723053 RepID=UPI00145F20B3|nr:sigma-70 family RNA polymerase sigma factor [Bacillus sp. DNRA2]NMD72713.1 sigma-70 family RNA polymerase sigma factor [Bacillus sp. DNRA2]